jgi:hypothetical protein
MSIGNLGMAVKGTLGLEGIWTLSSEGGGSESESERIFGSRAGLKDVLGIKSNLSRILLMNVVADFARWLIPVFAIQIQHLAK